MKSRSFYFKPQKDRRNSARWTVPPDDLKNVSIVGLDHRGVLLEDQLWCQMGFGCWL